MTTAKLCPMSRQACRADCMMYEEAKSKCAILWACYQTGEAAKEARSAAQAVKEASIEEVTYLKAVEDTVSASMRVAAATVAAAMTAPAGGERAAAKPDGAKGGLKGVGEGMSEFARSVNLLSIVNRRTGDVFRELYEPWCRENGYKATVATFELTKAIKEAHPVSVEGHGPKASYVAIEGRL